MLKQIHIKHFTIIVDLNVELTNGLTVLTGETGAGKSIIIDALELALGERADTALIQHGSDRCEITAIFDITTASAAKTWLAEQDLDIGDECFIRRVLSRDGRSRSAINGRPCSLQEVRELGSMLVQIHGQNQHGWLLKPEYQRELVDRFGRHDTQVQEVRDAYQQWKQAKQDLAACLQQEKNQGHEAQKELLTFHIQELEQLKLQADEWVQLTMEQQRLAYAEQHLTTCQRILHLLSEHDQGNVLKSLHSSYQDVASLPTQQEPALQRAMELLEQALIQVEEALTEIQHYVNRVEPNPGRLQFIDERLREIHNLARKHKVEPEELLALQQSLTEQLQQLRHKDDQIQDLHHLVDKMATNYAVCATRLTQNRQAVAQQLSVRVTEHMRQLGMPDGRFVVELLPYPANDLHAQGNERIEFLVATNKGQEPQPLAKIASGGELSRIALAIQVLTSQIAMTPTLIFDEVDVGIGGATAATVGQQLRALGQHAQVLCVTHQAQVAAKGEHHLHIHKETQQGTPITRLYHLSASERVHEVARMLGGITITDKTRAHAKELLETV